MQLPPAIVSAAPPPTAAAIATTVIVVAAVAASSRGSIAIASYHKHTRSCSSLSRSDVPVP